MSQPKRKHPLTGKALDKVVVELQKTSKHVHLLVGKELDEAMIEWQKTLPPKFSKPPELKKERE